MPSKEFSGVSEPQARDDSLKKDDWQSKPPSEGALSDDEGEVPIADTESNHSSQGPRSIKVSLPTECGSAREAHSRCSSRSASPGIKTTSNGTRQGTTEKARIIEPVILQDENENKLGISKSSKKVTVSRAEVPLDDCVLTVHQPLAVALETVKPIETHKKKARKAGHGGPRKLNEEASSPEKDMARVSPKASGYRKVTTELAVPVERLDDGNTKGSYRKTTNQLSAAVEHIEYPTATVIRHKPLRSRLPTEWTPDEVTTTTIDPTEERMDQDLCVRNRFGEINGDFVYVPEDHAQDLGEREEPSANENTAGTRHKARPKKKQLPKSKKRKLQARGSRPGSRSSTPSSMQLHDPSSSTHHTHLSEVENTSLSSCLILAAELESNATRDSQPAVKAGAAKKNKKSKGKRKPEQIASESRDELMQGNASKSREEIQITSKKSSASRAEPPAGEDRPGIPDVVGSSKSQKTKTGVSAQHEKKRLPSQANAVSPSADFEPPACDTRNTSPDANLFPQQKFSIDRARNAGPQTMNLDAETRPVATAENDQLEDKQPHALPQTERITKQEIGDWAAVVRGTLNNNQPEDPFASNNREEDHRDWVIKSCRKPRARVDGDEASRDQTSPTPSPEKKQQWHTKESTLNATAQSFSSSRASSPPPKLKLNPTATEFTSSRSSSPARSAAKADRSKQRPTDTRRAFSKQPNAAAGTGKNKKTAHTKKPSLPGQKSSGVDKRFVTPAEQLLDPNNLSQPGPPTKGKRIGSFGPRDATIPSNVCQNPNHDSVANEQSILADPVVVEEPKQDLRTATNDLSHSSCSELNHAVVAIPAPAAAKIIMAPVPSTEDQPRTDAPRPQHSASTNVRPAVMAEQVKADSMQADDQSSGTKTEWQTVISNKKPSRAQAVQGHGGRRNHHSQAGGRGQYARSVEEQKEA